MRKVTTQGTYERGREKFSRYKTLLSALSAFYRILPLSMRIALFNHHRYMGGKIGLGVRYALLKTIARKIGDNVAIYTGVYILNPQNLSLGNNVSIQPMAYLECGKTKEEGINIEDDVSIAHGVTILATTHTFSDQNIPIRDQKVISKRVCISNDVWIGAKATILCGITIANGCIIGAGAVVTKSTSERSVYAGVPAVIIKER